MLYILREMRNQNDRLVNAGNNFLLTAESPTLNMRLVLIKINKYFIKECHKIKE